jgi:hypothetical protein
MHNNAVEKRTIDKIASINSKFCQNIRYEHGKTGLRLPNMAHKANVIGIDLNLSTT